MGRGSASVLTALLLSLMTILTLLSAYLIVYRESMLSMERLSHRVALNVMNSGKNAKVIMGKEYLYLTTYQPPLNVLAALALLPNGSSKELVLNKPLSRQPTPLLSRELVSEIVSREHGVILIILSNGNYILVNKNAVSEWQGYSTALNTLNKLFRPYLLLGYTLNPNSYLENPVPSEDISNQQSQGNFKPELLIYLNNSTNVNYNYYTVSYVGNGTFRLNIHGDIISTIQISIPIIINRGVPTYRRVMFHITLNPTYCLLTTPYDVVMNLRPKLYVTTLLDYLRSPIITEFSDVMSGEQLSYAVAKSLYTRSYSSINLKAHADQYDYRNDVCKLYGSDATVVITLNSTEVFEDLPQEVNEAVALLTLLATTERNQAEIVNYTVIYFSIYDITNPVTINLDEGDAGKPLLIVSNGSDLGVTITGSGTTIKNFYKPGNVVFKNYRYVVWTLVNESGGYLVNIVPRGDVSITDKDIPPAISSDGGGIYLIGVYGYNPSVYEPMEWSENTYKLGVWGGVNEFTYYFTHEFTARIAGSGWSPIWDVTALYGNVTPEYKYALLIQSTSGLCQPLYVDPRNVTSPYHGKAYYKLYRECRLGVDVSTYYNANTKVFKIHAELTDFGDDYLTFYTAFLLNRTLEFKVVRDGFLIKYLDSRGNTVMTAIVLDDLLKQLAYFK